MEALKAFRFLMRSVSRNGLSFAIFVCLLPTLLSAPLAGAGASRAGVLANYGKLTPSFEENLGQAVPEVRFLSRGSAYTLWLTSKQAILSSNPVGEICGPEDRSNP